MRMAAELKEGTFDGFGQAASYAELNGFFREGA